MLSSSLQATTTTTKKLSEYFIRLIIHIFLYHFISSSIFYDVSTEFFFFSLSIYTFHSFPGFLYKKKLSRKKIQFSNPTKKKEFYTLKNVTQRNGTENWTGIESRKENHNNNNDNNNNKESMRTFAYEKWDKIRKRRKNNENKIELNQQQNNKSDSY